MTNSDNPADGAGESTQAAVQVARLVLKTFLHARAQWPGHRIEEMDVPLVVQEIADATRLALAAVAAALAELGSLDTISVQDGRIRVINPDGLMDAAKMDRGDVFSWLRD